MGLESPPQLRRKLGGGPGKHGVVHPVGQQGDVVVAGGEVVNEPLGGGKDHIGGQGQIALPPGGLVGPVPVAVVDHTPVGHLVQQVDVLRRGAPQQRLLEPVVLHLAADKLAQPAVVEAEQEAVPVLRLQHRGEGADRETGAYPAARLSGVFSRRLEQEHLGVPHAGHELLGAGGDSAPGVSRQAENLSHVPHLSSSIRAVSLLRRSTWRSRSTPPERKASSPMRAQAASMWDRRASSVTSSSPV